MKKIIILISFVLFFLCSCEKKGDFSFIYSENTNSYSVISYISDNSKVTIPSEFDDGVHGKKPVTTIGTKAFYGCKATEYELPDSIASISKFAFANTCIESINLENVQYIDDYAFYNTKITCEIVLFNITYIGNCSFFEPKHNCYNNIYVGCNSEKCNINPIEIKKDSFFDSRFTNIYYNSEYIDITILDLWSLTNKAFIDKK